MKSKKGTTSAVKTTYKRKGRGAGPTPSNLLDVINALPKPTKKETS